MIKHIFTFILGATIATVFYSCNNGDNFTIGQDLVDVKTNIVVTDTCTIRSFTIKTDSIITSATGKALVGSYSDKDLGLVNASTYFDMAQPTITLSSTAIYKSLTLCLHYSHYFYGDTTNPYTIKAYRLTEKLDDKKITSSGYSTGVFYNTSKVAYDTKLGEVSALVRPLQYDSIEIPLSNTFGSDLFSKIQNSTSEVQTLTAFTNYFKGFALVSDNSNSCVLGFGASDTSVYMRLNYKNGGQDSTLLIKMNVDANNLSYLQFNRIETDLSSTKLSALKKQEDMIPSSSTGNQTYCQAGTGIMTRLEFPYLKTLMESSNVKILKAEVVLSPIRSTYNLIPLPPKLMLYQLDNSNIIQSTLSDSNGSTITSTLVTDYEYNEQTAYTFDITSYITSAIQQTSTVVPALGVCTSSDQTFSTLNRVFLGDRQRNLNISKLKITYWRY